MKPGNLALTKKKKKEFHERNDGSSEVDPTEIRDCTKLADESCGQKKETLEFQVRDAKHLKVSPI